MPPPKCQDCEHYSAGCCLHEEAAQHHLSIMTMRTTGPCGTAGRLHETSGDVVAFRCFWIAGFLIVLYTFWWVY
jgi:hypothetical protein